MPGIRASGQRHGCSPPLVITETATPVVNLTNTLVIENRQKSPAPLEGLGCSAPDSKYPGDLSGIGTGRLVTHGAWSGPTSSPAPPWQPLRWRALPPICGTSSQPHPSADHRHPRPNRRYLDLRWHQSQTPDRCLRGSPCPGQGLCQCEGAGNPPGRG